MATTEPKYGFTFKHEMPRLSKDLKGEKSRTRCQACGLQVLFDPLPKLPQLRRWQEHDDGDRPEPIVVVLCKPCSNRLIEPHPRLYREMQAFEPHPGSMPICDDCTRREGVSCRHPEAKANGGQGVELIAPKPSYVHLQMSPRRHSGWRTLYTGPVISCKQKEAARAAQGPQ